MIIKPNKKYTGLYLIASGTARIGCFEGDREVTFGVGGPDTFFLSPKGSLENEKNSLFVEAFNEVTVLEWSKSQFQQLMNLYNDLCLWILIQCINQFLGFENRLNVIRRTAKERYEALFEGNARGKLSFE